MKFIHAADIHLDSPLRGLERYEGAPVDIIRGASRQAFVRLIDLCLEEKVDFLLIAGDLYDGNWPDFNTGLFFASQMSRLREGDIPVFLIRGNHDAASRITKQIPLPDNVKVFSIHHPETVKIDKLNVAIHGQSFATSAVADNLVQHYPQPVSGYFNIGLLHTCLNGREGHESYAPCSLSDLLAKNYDYWALGHIHKRELICESPLVLYPGNIQGRHAKETGEKGCSLVRVEGQDVLIEHRALDVLRWAASEVDVSDAPDMQAVFDLVSQTVREQIHEAGQRFLALRLVLTGASPVHEELVKDIDQTINSLRAVIYDSSMGSVWVEKIKLKTRRKESLDSLLEGNTPLAYLLKFIEELPNQPDLMQELLDDIKPLKSKLPPEFFGEEEPDLQDIQLIAKQIKDIEQLIITQLMKEGGLP